MKSVTVKMDVLLPHEVLHALAMCDADLMFESLMLGNRDPQTIAAFWTHLRGLGPWRDHPGLQDRSQDLSKVVALQFHADGAELYRDSEYFVYSFSSAFAGKGLVTDCLLYRFPLLIVAEKDMQQKAVARFLQLEYGWYRFQFSTQHILIALPSRVVIPAGKRWCQQDRCPSLRLEHEVCSIRCGSDQRFLWGGF